MSRKAKTDLLKCPCCSQRRSKTECTVFAAQCANEVPERTYVRRYGKFIYDEQYAYWADAIAGTNKNWACDSCLQQNRAMRAYPQRQLFCDFIPHFAFFDKSGTCRDCGQEFVFSKGEQQFWFEKLRFWVQTDKVRCDKCRLTKNQHTRLSHLLDLHCIENQFVTC